MRDISLGKLTAVVGIVFGLTVAARAAEMTAFQLAKEGNRYIGEESKDQVVEIHSDKSVGSLTPNIWYIVYYDPDAALKAVQVKFGAGRKMDVKRTFRLLEPMNGGDKKLDRKKLNVDSDKALSTAMSDPLLANLTIKASQMWLERSDEGPRWKVRLWAAKLKNPNDTANIGDIFVLAEDGKVVKRDLRIDRVD